MTTRLVFSLFVFFSFVVSLEFTGSRTPESDMEKMFESFDAAEAAKSLSEFGVKVPSFVQTLASSQSKGNLLSSALGLLGKLKDKASSSNSNSNSNNNSNSNSNNNSQQSSAQTQNNSAQTQSQNSSTEKQSIAADSADKEKSILEIVREVATTATDMKDQFKETQATKEAAANSNGSSSPEAAAAASAAAAAANIDPSTGATSTTNPASGVVTTTDNTKGITTIYNPQTGITTTINTKTGETTISSAKTGSAASTTSLYGGTVSGTTDTSKITTNGISSGTTAKATTSGTTTRTGTATSGTTTRTGTATSGTTTGVATGATTATTRTGTVGTTAKTTGTTATTRTGTVGTTATTRTATTKTTGTTTTTKTTGTTTGAKTAAGNTSQTATVSAKASQDMVDKYVAEEKGNAKASAIVTTKVDVVSNQCTKGECCDSNTGKYKAAGQTCYSSPCSSASACLGVSSTCPPSSTYLPDGSVCPNGVCQLGICIPSSAAEKVKALLSSTTTTIPTVTTTTAPKRHSVSNPSSSPSSTSLGRHKFYAFDNKIKCKQGGCCDLKTGFVKLAGTSCTESKHECYEESGKCNGFEYKCPRKAKANGTECSIGQCMNGICKKENAALASSASSGETLSKVNMKKNEDLDISLNLLEEKIQKAKERQEKIKSDILHNKKEEQRNLIRSTLKNVHQQVKSELDLSKRNVFPYQTTTTKAQALDNKKSDFNIHDYIRQIHEEENRYHSNTLSKATANLQSSNKGASFPWFFVGAFVIFVAVVALIVGIVKVVGGKKNKQKIDSDEYENF